MLQDITGSRRNFIGAAAAALAGAGIGATYAKQHLGSGPASEPLPAEGNMPPLDGASTWLNTEPLTTAGLRGRVVLVQFWTYTCINWLRTLPYVRAWADRYQATGLVVLGVHTPEFSFEHELENVRRAAKDMRVDYPIAVDNDYAVWDAFGNHYWPALYFVDAGGRIRHHHFGEGAYAESERILQQLLSEAGSKDLTPELSAIDPRGAEVAADWDDLGSAESYLGYARTDNFASDGGVRRSGPQMYAIPERLRRNQWALAGEWQFEPEGVVLVGNSGRLAYQFHARDLHLVMGPTTPEAPVRFRVLIDGLPPRAAHGFDVDEQGNGLLAGQRLYQLIRQPLPVSERRFEIEFLDPGAAAYVFTFG